MMKRSDALAIALLVCMAAADARSIELPGGFQLQPGGRMEYRLQIERNGSPDPWDFDSGNLPGSARLMLDMRAISERYGSLYLKGATVRDAARAEDGRRLFSFAQGDYLRRWEDAASSIGVRFFANERRFFTGEYIAPALRDDFAGEAGENRGVRLEGTFKGRARIESVAASLGSGWDDARKLAFVRAAYLGAPVLLSLSYLCDAPASDAALRRAVLKSEVVGFYRSASIICSYEQSRLHRDGVCMPHLSFDISSFVGDNFSSILPDEGAFFAEMRIMTLPFRELGTVDIVYDYFAVGEEFVNDLGMRSGERVGYLLGAYFEARDAYLNGRFRIGRSVRSSMERDTEERIDASIWGGLSGGIDFTMRGGWKRSWDEFSAASTRTRIMGTATFHEKKIRNDFHCLLRDPETEHASLACAWSARAVLNADFAVDWRFMLSHNYEVRDAVFCRLEFRPSRRVYAYVSYGRQYAGDDPFMLEDQDLNLSNIDPSVYAISMRGDF